MADVIGFYREYDEYGCFSNFYKAPFEFEGVQFTYSEQMIMWQKAMLFGDTRVAEQILHVLKPVEAKSLGRRVTPYDDAVWTTKRAELVVPGLYAKFEQNSDIRSILLGTGDSILAECAPRDKIWGIGLPVWNPDIFNPQCWRGSNCLGQYLMTVRKQLREAGYSA